MCSSILTIYKWKNKREEMMQAIFSLIFDEENYKIVYFS